MSSKKRKAKIICTLGPASSSIEKILELIQAGMDVARLNFSHGTYETHEKQIQLVRECAKKTGKTIAILQDLQGPKLRVGKISGGKLYLKSGDRLALHPESNTHTSKGKIAVPISDEIATAIAKDAQKGGRILFDDGKIEGKILSIKGKITEVEIENNGILTDHKGVNLPGTTLSIPSITEKDLEDLQFGLSQGVDGVALSFVRKAADIESVRKRIQKNSNLRPLLVSKFEREEAIDEMEAIIEVSDVLMIARGDLAVEIGAERVPAIQKQLIRACNELGVPVITATQMLESMITSPTPTRAEASDVANAVFDGTDCLMLSAETASGQYPLESVQTMAKIIIEAERSGFQKAMNADSFPGSIVDAIEASAARMAKQVDAVAIACLTHSGMAARTLAKYRPETQILAILDNAVMLRKLAFVWGVRGELIPKLLETDDLFAMVESVLRKNGWAEPQDLVVVTAGIPTLRRGTTNMVKIHKIGVQDKREPT